MGKSYYGERLGFPGGRNFQPRLTNSLGFTPSASAILRTVIRRGLTFWPVSSCIIVVGLTLALSPRVRCDQNLSSRNSFSLSPLNMKLIPSGIVTNFVQSFHSLLIFILADFLNYVKFSLALLMRSCYTVVDIKKATGTSLATDPMAGTKGLETKCPSLSIARQALTRNWLAA